MSNTVISVEHLTKQYDLGVIGTGTLSRDLNRWWARLRKQPDPYTRIGQKDAFAHIGESILALDDVSFTVQQGEALGIIGRNGAGKSTLLKILSRVTAPTRGVVKVKGRIGSLLEVGTGFHPELTGRENVYLNGAILGMKKTEVARKFDEIVDFAGVEKFIDTPVKRYSSGMYVRLAFAVAAHLDPEILIVDEVLAVGDAEFQKKCLGKMGDVTGEGRTVLFVSHNMAAIQKLCGRCIALKLGSICNDNLTEDVIQWYLQDSKEDNNNLQERVNNNGPFIFSEVYVESRDEKTKSPVSGEPINVVMKYYSKVDLKRVIFLFTIYNNFDIPVAHFNSSSYNYLYDIDVGEGIIKCHIEKLPLPLGHYKISVAAESYLNTLDHVSNACSFSVETSQFFPSLNTPSINYSTALIEHNWFKNGNY